MGIWQDRIRPLQDNTLVCISVTIPHWIGPSEQVLCETHHMSKVNSFDFFGFDTKFRGVSGNTAKVSGGHIKCTVARITLHAEPVM